MGFSNADLSTAARFGAAPLGKDYFLETPDPAHEENVRIIRELVIEQRMRDYGYSRQRAEKSVERTLVITASWEPRDAPGRVP